MSRDLVPWIEPGLRSGVSRIHGTGVIATRPFETGDLLFRLGGYLIGLERRRDPVVVPSTTTAVSEGIVLCELHGSEKDLSDYLNHSCSPNVGFRDALHLVASRSIEVGDEVCMDYAFCEADGSWELQGPCRCGSRQCRSQVTGQDWSLPALRDEYLRWASPFIRRRICEREKR